VSYIVWVILYTKFFLGKSQKKKSLVKQKYGWWNYVDIDLKGMGYESVFTGFIWMILISCSLCDVGNEVLFTGPV